MNYKLILIFFFCCSRYFVFRPLRGTKAPVEIAIHTLHENVHKLCIRKWKTQLLKFNLIQFCSRFFAGTTTGTTRRLRFQPRFNLWLIALRISSHLRPPSRHDQIPFGMMALRRKPHSGIVRLKRDLHYPARPVCRWSCGAIARKTFNFHYDPLKVCRYANKGLHQHGLRSVQILAPADGLGERSDKTRSHLCTI